MVPILEKQVHLQGAHVIQSNMQTLPMLTNKDVSF